ncbi:MAG: ATP-binding protein [Prevotella sp.]|nr:ATP-binding protein [Prevotella sp.]
MTTYINPFVVSGRIPEELFCDRKEEARQLQMAMENQLNVVLTSSRRMGKTSLVDYVFNKSEINENHITISVDILHTTTFREFIYTLGTSVFKKVASRNEKMRRLFVTTLKSLSASFGYDPVQNTPTFDIKLGDITNPDFTIEEIFSFLEQADKRCLVVIDEFQQISKYPEKNVEAILRSQIQKMQNANFIFAGSQRRLMEEMFFSSRRPFYQSAKAIKLEPIEMGIYTEFVLYHFHQANKDISTEAVQKVYQAFKGVTLYLQRIMKDAYAMTAEGERCDVATTDMLTESFIMENDSRIREQLAYITEPQKELLYAIHDEQEVISITSASFTKKHHLKSPSATQSAALKLLDDDLITRIEKVYRLADPLMELWMDRKNM